MLLQFSVHPDQESDQGTDNACSHFMEDVNGQLSELGEDVRCYLTNLNTLKNTLSFLGLIFQLNLRSSLFIKLTLLFAIDEPCC